jgi:hypothetical protein
MVMYISINKKDLKISKFLRLPISAGPEKGSKDVFCLSASEQTEKEHFVASNKSLASHRLTDPWYRALKSCD